ncbi:MAG: DUF433 domain-containing protein [Pedosphaera sp.]|nr:DUF433 domain-containing protein [Pedosphaera sp.]
MTEMDPLTRITYNPAILGGKAIIRGRRLAVEHVLGLMAAGHDTQTILEDFPWLEAEDLQACLLYAKRMVAAERTEPALVAPEA